MRAWRAVVVKEIPSSTLESKGGTGRRITEGDEMKWRIQGRRRRRRRVKKIERQSDREWDGSSWILIWIQIRILSSIQHSMPGNQREAEEVEEGCMSTCYYCYWTAKLLPVFPLNLCVEPRRTLRWMAVHVDGNWSPMNVRPLTFSAWNSSHSSLLLRPTLYVYVWGTGGDAVAREKEKKCTK